MSSILSRPALIAASVFVPAALASAQESVAAWTATSSQAQSQFGAAAANAGDVNGDGYADIVVGAPNYSNGQTEEGGAFLYLGSALGPGSTPAWISESDDSHSVYGVSLAGAGDIDGDGYDDVIVGAPYFHDGTPTMWGRAWLFRGSAAGLAGSASWVATGSANSALGNSVAGAGDLNGDGYSDAIVGVPGLARCFVYLGSASGLSAAPILLTSSPTSSAFGGSVDGAGDVDGDGFGDVIVGASLFADDVTNEGRAVLFRGRASGVSAVPAWTADSDNFLAQFGVSVAGAGDVNGDGLDDVIVGAPFWNSQFDAYGNAFVFHGNATTALTLAPVWTPGKQQKGSEFGLSVAGAGDVNGDGLADVVIGAPVFHGVGNHGGRVYVHHGSTSGLSTIADWTAQSSNSLQHFGSAVAGGDVNGDGLADVIVGSNYFDSHQNASVYYGCAACATTATYGAGKPGSFLPRLYTDAPVLGASSAISLVGAKPSAPAFLVAGLSPATIPFDSGLLLVAPLLTVTLPPIPVNGSLSFSAMVPSDPQLAALELYFQGFFIDPAAPGPYDTIQTNGVHWTLGN